MSPQSSTYAPDVDYFGKEHLPYATLAIICLSIFSIFPVLLLILYPCSCFQKLLNRLHVRWFILRTLMDSFQGCYKDGTETGTRDCRWISSIYFLTGFTLFTAYTFSLSITSFNIWNHHFYPSSSYLHGCSAVQIFCVPLQRNKRFLQCHNSHYKHLCFRCIYIRLLQISKHILLCGFFIVSLSCDIHCFVCTLQNIATKENHSPVTVQVEGLEARLRQAAGVWGRGTVV